MPTYRTFRRETYTVESAGWMPEDPPTVSTYTRTVPGETVEAADRGEALEAGRNLYGRDAAGVERVGVRCQFCEDTAAATLRPDEPGVYCPRCTDMIPSDHHR